MLERLRKEYKNHYEMLLATYADRISPLKRRALSDIGRFAENKLPLFCLDPSKGARHVTLSIMELDLLAAAKEGKKSVEYTLNTYLYQGWNGDNVSMLTGSYYMAHEGNIPGAPSYLALLEERFEGLLITFTEQTSLTGLLRIEIPV